jgi:regulator of cell morphogenesis and NO signaling
MNTKLTQNMTVGDIVVEFPQIRTVLETLGIDYCCGGKIPLNKAAEQAGLSADKVLADLTQALEKTEQDDASVEDWNATSLTELADHIEQTHHVFMKEQLPRLADLLNKTIRAHSERHGEMLNRLKHTYTSLKTDIEAHLGKEEQILFPLIRQMEAFQQNKGPAPDMHCGSIANPIRQMEHEHDVAGQFLTQMRRITSNYTLPDDACPTFMALFEGLDALEKDLHVHIHLENNILFPKAQDLEDHNIRVKPVS